MEALQKLEDTLNNPSIPWRDLVITFTLGQYALEQFLSVRQYRNLCSKTLPTALKGVIDQETFDKSQAYGR